ncbi:hypothetical protein C0993_001949 [Termitomyces sp. T159_Od127]|nr:hypothetical protein C0993_001949 [Termitomyces sp. T159_Od127]
MRCPTNYVSLSRTKSPVPVHRDENTGPHQQEPPQCKSPPPTASFKESRAFEHDRQRLKKAAVLLARNARKSEAKTTQVIVKPQQQSARRGGAGVHVEVNDRDDEDELVLEENEVEWGEARSPSLRLGPPEDAQREREREGIRTRGLHRAEVALSDFLIARKPRRGREQDFEVVPPLRSVIVLDDIATPELDFDEPWEHVYASDADNNHRPELSYAKIVALH